MKKTVLLIFVFISSIGFSQAPIAKIQNHLESQKEINNLSNEIQCRVGEGGISLGTAQKPELWDYADGVDTIDFLTKI